MSGFKFQKTAKETSPPSSISGQWQLRGGFKCPGAMLKGAWSAVLEEGEHVPRSPSHINFPPDQAAHTGFTVV